MFCQGRCLQFFKGGCFVKVGVCNILREGVLSQGVGWQYFIKGAFSRKAVSKSWQNYSAK